MPFPEHQKDGAMYVEVDPDAEYFVNIRRVSMNFPAPITCYVQVDGQILGWTASFIRESSGHGNYLGLREV